MTFAVFAELGRAVERGEPKNITIRQLADLSGFSDDKLRSLIGTHLAAFPVGPKQSWYYVTYAEALRFLRDLRLIP